MPRSNLHLRQAGNTVSREFFQALLVTYLLLTVAETLKDGYVSNFFNMNYLLVVVLASGIIMVLTEQAERIRAIPRRTSRAFIGLAVKGAYQAKQARLAAQQTLNQHHNVPLRPRVRPTKGRNVDGIVQNPKSRH